MWGRERSCQQPPTPALLWGHRPDQGSSCLEEILCTSSGRGPQPQSSFCTHLEGGLIATQCWGPVASASQVEPQQARPIGHYLETEGGGPGTQTGDLPGRLTQSCGPRSHHRYCWLGAATTTAPTPTGRDREGLSLVELGSQSAKAGLQRPSPQGLLCPKLLPLDKDHFRKLPSRTRPPSARTLPCLSITDPSEVLAGDRGTGTKGDVYLASKARDAWGPDAQGGAGANIPRSPALSCRRFTLCNSPMVTLWS